MSGYEPTYKIARMPMFEQEVEYMVKSQNKKKIMFQYD